MAACRLGSKGHTMADSSYNAEVKNIEQFLSLQKPSSTPTHISTPIAVSEDSIEQEKQNKGQHFNVIVFILNFACVCF